jgi:pimeloyl-ACP methyl ester carboxylesterase/DNA-binding CsgD family transcriptional regulator
MDAPPVQYVRTQDGLNIAFGVSGSGMPLVFIPGVFNHVQLGWQYPGLAPWLELLSQRFQLIQLDIRGTGMSSRDVPEDHVQEHYLRDIEAVVDRLQLDRFVYLGVTIGAHYGIDYALAHPERLIGLVLGTSGRNRAPVVLRELPAQDWEFFLNSIVPRHRTLEERAHIVELHKQGSDQQNYLRRYRAFIPTEEREERLQRLTTPTLVLHARDYALTPVEEGMRVAQLCGGRLVLIDGADPWGDAGQGVAAIEAFLADVAPAAAPGSVRTDLLSARELDVLRLVAAGRSNAQIAEALVISPNTVGRHVSNIFDKTGAANRAEAVAYAMRNGLA